ncbi:MAG: CDP-alcohol phosphatidyltransferase family protein [Alistipes sp.]|nr:CDP-alcohol phosphatidyltransferase family protein [Alistipes sp.]
MKIKLFTVPNMLTLCNLLCGAGATVSALVWGDLKTAFILVIASAVFDFFDGFSARLLNQYSAIGVQLDSLADMVSFGLAPAAVMMTLFAETGSWCEWQEWMVKVGYFVPLVMTAFSALRLAKFNIDDSQHSEFEGLPTPANALFCMSLGMLAEAGLITMPREAIVILSVVMALLLICPVRMFSLKFEGFGWGANKLRYIFLLVAVAIVAVDYRYAVTAIMALYVVVSTVIHLFGGNKNVQ